VAERTVEVPFEEETIRVSYESDRLGEAGVAFLQGLLPPADKPTGSLAEMWQAASSRAIQPFALELGALVEGLAAVITGWDIEEHGQPYPPTVGNLSEVPADVLYRISRAIGADVFPS
jgi:hypothetical protein